MTDKKT